MRLLLALTPMLVVLPLAAHAAPPGTYRRTCTDVSTSGAILNATCRGAGGRMFDTTLDTSRCRVDIGNSYGRLVCGDIQGSATQVRGGSGDDDQGYSPSRQRAYSQDDDYDQPRRGYSRSYRDDDDQPTYRRPRYYDPDQDN